MTDHDSEKNEATSQKAIQAGNPGIDAVPQEPRHHHFEGTIDFHLVTDDPRDVRVLSQISRATFYDTFIHITRPDDMEAYLDRAYSPEELGAQIGTPGSAFYFLLADGKLAGYLKLNRWSDDNSGAALSDPLMRHPGAFEIERLYIIPAFKHRGLGRSLMRFSEQKARQEGSDTMWLGVWEGNTPAQRLYASQGFELVGRHTFQVGHDPQTDLIMKRDL